RSAIRTDPVVGNVGPSRPGSDAVLGQPARLVVREAAAETQILLHADLVASSPEGETHEVRHLRPHGSRRLRSRPAVRLPAAPDRALRAGGLSRLSPG